MNKREIVFQFVDAINQKDIPNIINLMAENYEFIDAYGNSQNKESMIQGWQGYFEWFPDYLITINEIMEN